MDDGFDIGKVDSMSRPGPANASTSGSQRSYVQPSSHRSPPSTSETYALNSRLQPSRERRVSNGLRDAGLSSRSSRLFGASNFPPGPPPGPPPSEPPPLPPSSHPFAQQTPSAPQSQRGYTAVASSSHAHEDEAVDRPQLSPRISSLPRQQSVSAPARTQQQPRTPSRHLLQSALDLAQKAVDLDRVNDVSGALEKYREAVTRLRSVMERVGVEPGPPPADVSGSESQSAIQQHSNSARGEEEGRTLRGIHDAYVARIGLLLGFQAEEEEASRHAMNGDAGLSRHPYGPDDTAAAGIGSLMLDDVGYSDSHHFSPPRSSQATSNRARTLSSARRSMDLLADADNTASAAGRDLISALPHDPAPAALVQGSSVGASAGKRSSAAEAAAARRQSLVSSLGLGPSPVQHVTFPRQKMSQADSPMKAKRMPRESIGLDIELEEAEAQVAEEMDSLSRTPRVATYGSEAEQEPRTKADSRGSRLGRSMASSVSSQNSLVSLGDDRPLPPLPGVPFFPDTNRPGISARKTSLSGASSASGSTAILVSPTTSQGTISQRRKGESRDASISSMGDIFRGLGGMGRNKGQGVQEAPRTGSTTGSKSPSIDGLPHSASSRGSMSAAVGGMPTVSTRMRSASQPQRPSLSFRRPSGSPSEPVPPIPSVNRKVSLPTQPAPERTHLRIVTERGTPSPASTMMASRFHDLDSPTRSAQPYRGLPLPPNEVFPPAASGSSASMLLMAGTQHGSLLSPLPEPVPTLLLHRPFHLLRQLRSTILSPTGGYATRRLHIPREVWSQGGAKLASLETKVKVIELLVFQLRTVEACGTYLLESGSRDSREFLKALDDLDGLFDECQKMLGKKLGLTLGGVKGKKLSGTGMANWGSKFARSLDRIANGKNLDSPTAYVDALTKLCQASQVLDQYLSSYTGPQSQFGDLPSKISNHIELRLRRSSEFFGALIVPFVVEDLKSLLFKYLKHGNRWLDE